MTDSFDAHPKRQLNIRKPYLELISKGIKTVEVRVGYPSMRKIQPGQDLEFISGNDTVMTRVKRVAEYSSLRTCSLGKTRFRLVESSVSPRTSCLLLFAVSIHLRRNSLVCSPSRSNSLHLDPLSDCGCSSLFLVFTQAFKGHVQKRAGNGLA